MLRLPAGLLRLLQSFVLAGFVFCLFVLAARERRRRQGWNVSGASVRCQLHPEAGVWVLSFCDLVRMVRFSWRAGRTWQPWHFQITTGSLFASIRI